MALLTPNNDHRFDNKLMDPCCDSSFWGSKQKVSSQPRPNLFGQASIRGNRSEAYLFQNNKPDLFESMASQEIETPCCDGE